MNPSAILFIVLLTLSQIVYWAQGNKGMRNYLALLAGGTVLQLLVNNLILLELSLVIIEIRLISTILGLVSEKWRRNDDFFYSIKCALGGMFIDIVLFKVEIVNVGTIYFVFQLVALLLVIFYFIKYNPLVTWDKYSIKLFGFEIATIPKSFSATRHLAINDMLLTTIGLFALWSVALSLLSPDPMTKEFWWFHQLASIIQAGIFIIIGLFYWRKHERLA